jgi:preprotein translocase subunit SecE
MMDAERSSAVKSRKTLFSYIQDLKEELRKVSWTSQEELRFSTKMVVLATFAFGLGIYLVDFLIKGGLDLIKTIVRFIFG